MRRFRTRIKVALAATAVAVFAVSTFASGYLHLRFRMGPTPVGAPTGVPSGESWIDLLDTTNAPAWRYTTDDESAFDIHDGVLHLYGRAFYPLQYVMFTGSQFRDFELHVEFKLEQGANSGLFLLAQSDDPVERGFEVQIIDDHGRRPNKHGSGAIYDVVTPMFNMALPAGDWNSLDVRVDWPNIEVVMNGWLVVKANFDQMGEPLGKFEMPYADLPREGRIMIQDHGGEAWFRNLRVRPISPPLDPSPPQPGISPRGE